SASWLKTAQLAPLSNPRRMPTRVSAPFRVCQSHTCSVPSVLPEARYWLVGLKATHRTRSFCPVKLPTRTFLFHTSSIRTAPSKVPPAMMSPAGLNAALSIGTLCGIESVGAAALTEVLAESQSQNLTVLSRLPETRCLPSGLDTSTGTALSCPRKT